MSKVQRSEFFGTSLDIDIMGYNYLTDKSMVLRKKISLITIYYLFKLQNDKEIVKLTKECEELYKDNAVDKISNAIYFILDKAYPKSKAIKSCSLRLKEAEVIDTIFPPNFFKDLRKERNAINIASRKERR